MTDAREQLIELRRFLGSDKAFCDAIWACRENASAPPPKLFQRSWKWSRAKVVSLNAFRKRADQDAELVGSGAHRL